MECSGLNSLIIKQQVLVVGTCCFCKEENELLFEKIDHLAIICHDEQQAVDFYVNKLGFTIQDRHERPEKNDVLFHLNGGSFVIELFIKATAPARLTDPEALGLRHLAFKVADIEQAVRDLATRGIDCESVRRDDFTGEKMTFFFGPDRLPLELHE